MTDRSRLDYIERLADAFAHMVPDEQALFFNHVYTISSEWGGTSWQAETLEIIQSDDLNGGGRKVLRTISDAVQEDKQAISEAIQEDNKKIVLQTALDLAQED